MIKYGLSSYFLFYLIGKRTFLLESERSSLFYRHFKNFVYNKIITYLEERIKL